MHTCKRRERDKERRRQDIIRVAGDLFFLRGYDRVAMDDVAAAAELSIGTIYLYFRNKDALFCAVVLDGVSALNGMFRNVIQRPGTGAEKMRSLGDAYLEFYRGYPGQFRAFVEMQSRPYPAGEEMARISAVVQENVYDIMCRCLAEGVRDGSLRRELDPLQTTMCLILSMQSVICLTPPQQAALDRAGVSHDEFIHNSLRLLIKSIEVDRSGGNGG
jgi:AcrR family transcriptional regulator